MIKTDLLRHILSILLFYWAKAPFRRLLGEPDSNLGQLRPLSGVAQLL
jgi:hypothetical protein